MDQTFSSQSKVWLAKPWQQRKSDSAVQV